MRIISYAILLLLEPQLFRIITKQKPVFDNERLSEEEKFDGYYAIVTSELEKTDEEIIEIYRGLWKIEESFKITKSDLESRPVYLSCEDRIQAHFLICFVALTIARILEFRLGNIYSVARIIESLSSVCVDGCEARHAGRESLGSLGDFDRKL
jgi:transposase